MPHSEPLKNLMEGLQMKGVPLTPEQVSEALAICGAEAGKTARQDGRKGFSDLALMSLRGPDR